MNKTLISAIGVAVALAFAGSAVAATKTHKPAPAKTYYVGQLAKSKKCEVTSHKPNGKTVMMIGKSTYKSVADAKKAMEAAPDCKKKG